MAVQISPQSVKSFIFAHLLNGAVTDLVQALDELLDSGSEELLEKINQVLAMPECLCMLVGLIRNNPALFEKMRAGSYYHENGFHKIVLLSGRNYKLRLHHFGASSKQPMENVHDHRWPFASSILSGKLEMDLFEVSEDRTDAEKLYHFIYNSDKQDGSYGTDLRGLAYVKKTETRRYAAGESYLMLPHELHRITNAPGEESVTLILTGKAKSRLCNLYARREIMESEKVTARYAADTLHGMLDQIMESLFPQKN